METNTYTWIILAALFTNFILNLVSDYFNLKNLRSDIPDEFKKVYSDEKYKKSQEYTRVRSIFSYFPTVIDLIILITFWFSGGFEYLDSLVKAAADSIIWQGLIFIGIISAAQSIISIPFQIYSTFVIEERFGFNKTNAKTFILDRIKSIGLTIIIGGPVLAGLIFILNDLGATAWLYAWIGLTVFTFIIQYIAPKFIMPLFNKFTPLEEGELRDAIFELCKKIEYPVKNLFVIDGSKRSSKSNAFFTGFGKNKRIALYDTLIEKHSIDEILAILAHEIGHFKKKHILRSQILSIVHSGIMLYLLSIFLFDSKLFQAFYMTQTPVYAGLLFFGLLYTPVNMVLSILMNIWSRKNEFEADAFALKTIGEPESMISALKKLSENNLSNLTPHRFYVFMNYSHPPLLKRIKALRE